MKNRILLALMIVALIAASTTISLAQTTEQTIPATQTNNNINNEIVQEKVMEIPVYNSIEEANRDAMKEQTTKELESSKSVNVLGIGITNMSYFVVRNGNTKTCQIYGKWKSTQFVNKFSFQSLVVYNGKSNAKYLTIKPAAGHKYRWYTFTASKMGTYRIPKNYNVPLSVKKVKIKVVDQMVSLAAYDWLSLGNFTIEKEFL